MWLPCESGARERGIHEVAVARRLGNIGVRQVPESHGPIGKESLLRRTAYGDDNSFVPRVGFDSTDDELGVFFPSFV